MSVLSVRILVALAIGAIMLCGDAKAKANAQLYDFAIEEGTLGDALSELAKQARTGFLYPYELAQSRDFHPVTGRMTLIQALSEMLRDSQFSASLTKSEMIVVSRRRHEPEGNMAGKFESALMASAATLLIGAGAEAADIARVGDSGVEREETMRDEIIVTGTNIRGRLPAGSPVLSFDRLDIEKSGAMSMDEFLRLVPQNFSGSVTNVGSGNFPNDTQSAVNRTSFSQSVNLRGLGAGSTLTLLNGRRLAPNGSQAGFVDISVIPLSAIERVEVLSDGASSIYGADAIAGVVNFILRDSYEGLETRVTATRSTESDFTQIGVAQTAGGSWSSGNALLSYEFFDQSNLPAEDRGFARGVTPDGSTLLPGQTRHNAVGVFSQELSSTIDFDLTAIFGTRTTTSRLIDPVRNRDMLQDVKSTKFSISPMLTADLSDSWRVRLSGNYGRTEERGDTFSTALTTGEVMPAATSASDRDIGQYATDIVIDGDVLQVPGGALSVALGAAYLKEEIYEDVRRFDGSLSGNTDLSRDVWSLFAELAIPVVGQENALPGLRALSVSASARYDQYGELGDTLNPKVGASWTPVDGLNLRGSYGTSFKAPNITERPRVTQASTTLLFDPATGVRNQPALLIYGIGDLTPETSRTYTFGFDYKAAIGDTDGTLSLTYYNIRFSDRISSPPLPPGGTLSVLQNAYYYDSSLLMFNPALSDVLAVIDAAEIFSDGVQTLTGVPADLGGLVASFDTRRRNLAETRTDGLDLSATFSTPAAGGDLTLGFNANYILNFEEQLAPALDPLEPFNRLFLPVDFQINAQASWARGPWRLNTSFNHISSYENDYAASVDKVKAWTTIDAGVSYIFEAANGPTLLNGLRLSASVRNLLDTDPPRILVDDAVIDGWYTASFDSANANPFGRLVQISLVKQW